SSTTGQAGKQPVSQVVPLFLPSNHRSLIGIQQLTVASCKTECDNVAVYVLMVAVTPHDVYCLANVLCTISEFQNIYARGNLVPGHGEQHGHGHAIVHRVSGKNQWLASLDQVVVHSS